MTDLSYAPTFEHTDWIDNVDRIEAGGPRGLNARLHAIESDLRQVATVVERVNTEIDLIVTPGPSAPVRRLVFTPMLLPGPSNTAPWLVDPDGALLADPTSGQGSFGLLNLSLPGGARLLTMRVIGLVVNSSSPFTITVTLFRVPAQITAATPIVQSLLALQVGTGGSFDLTGAFPTAQDANVVDLGSFRYFLVISLGNFNPFDQNMEVEVRSVELDYQSA